MNDRAPLAEAPAEAIDFEAAGSVSPGSRALRRLSKLGAWAASAAANVDAAAFMAALTSTAIGILVFLAIPADNRRLAVFLPEQVENLAMEDSTPFRMALFTLFALIALFSVAIRFSYWPRLPLTVQPSLPIRMAGLAVISVVVSTIILIGDMHLRLQYAGSLWFWVVCSSYVIGAAAFVLNARLPASVIGACTAIGVALTSFHAGDGMMGRIDTHLMPWFDLHQSALFSAGQMSSLGFNLFSNGLNSYGTLTPTVLAGAIKAGATVDYGTLRALISLFQAAALVLFLTAAWARVQENSWPEIFTICLFIVLVSAPYLSMDTVGFYFPNQSAYRFIMFPVAVLTLEYLRRGAFRFASPLAGAVAALALLHNTETGVALTSGLGLGWLVRAREETMRETVVSLLAVLVGALAILGLFVLGYFSVFGGLPFSGSLQSGSLFEHFLAGFGGQRPKLRIVVLIMGCHAAYIVIRALACVLGAQSQRVDAASAGLAGMILAWSPYYGNRPDDMNLWITLLTYALLLAPAIVRERRRPAWLGLIAGLLIVPFPVAKVMSNQSQHARAMAMHVAPSCIAGLSLPPPDCAEQRQRADELVRMARPGDVFWLSAYPFTLLQTTGLRPLMAPLDFNFAARTEADLSSLAGRIAAANPSAVLLDAAAPVPADDPVPAPVRALYVRIARRSGYGPCALIATARWQVWLRLGECKEAGQTLKMLRGRIESQ